MASVLAGASIGEHVPLATTPPGRPVRSVLRRGHVETVAAKAIALAVAKLERAGAFVPGHTMGT
jgi:hypothetical protein